MITATDKNCRFVIFMDERMPIMEEIPLTIHIVLICSQLQSLLS